MNKKMYYIQNYNYNQMQQFSTDKNTVDRFLDGQYMGAAEFEFGSCQDAWAFLRENAIKLFSIVVSGGSNRERKEVKFYVITTDEGYERFKEHISIHLDGERIGRITKEHTGIYDKFFSSFRKQKFANAWLDVSCFVSRSFSNSEHTDNAIFFTDEKQTALRTFLELKRQTQPELKVFDEVFCYKDTSSFKICGLNEDDSVSVKQKYSKAIKMNALDLWTKTDLIGLQINECIMDEALRFNI